ncbi:acyl-CoA synthetase MbcS [Scopulibacillus cellulosilyticus]|uniref:Acyl-CoA synthetase MbcS n=1 Tax=Scopulibacillus cellulosilyticus TaxID=2665665 RepID=A0ABW2PY79_9BACL
MEDLIAPEIYNLTDEIEAFARDPQRIALKFEDLKGETAEITYADLIKRSNQLANGMLSKGLKKGDRILIMMPRSIETYIAYIASLKSGLVIIPSSEMLRAKDLSYRIQHAEVKAVLIHDDLADRVDKQDEKNLLLKVTTSPINKTGWVTLDEIMENQSKDQTPQIETRSDDMAFISYTSGTTGQPKGVVHTHGWAYAHLRTASNSWMDIQMGDMVWATAGPGWQKWLWSPFISTLGSGATGFVYQGPFDPEVYLNLLDKYEINVLCCTPTEYRLMAKVDNLSAYHLGKLRSAVSAGEPLNREVIDIFKEYFDIDVRDGYGQTENTLLVGTVKGMEAKPGSMGKPTPGNLVEIITEEGEAADVGEIGDIAVHRSTPALFKEYFKDPERTKAAFRGDYYVTGDKAKKDKDGYFWFEGRGDDIIISSGYTIGPFEVEDALVKHSKVKECAVVASPDEIRGNIVKAFVILKNPDDACEKNLVKELQDHVKTLTAPYKYPRKIEFVKDLPKTTSGKIRRIELRQRESI